jgi:hypothetical protein
MWNIKKITLFFTLALWLTACHKDTLAPNASPAEQMADAANSTESYRQKTGASTTLSVEQTPESLVLAAPTISSISSSENTIGAVFGTYKNYLGIDFDGQTEWIVKGNNFGTARGSVTFIGVPFIVTQTTWLSNTSIKLRVKSTGTRATPTIFGQLKVITSSGLSVVKTGILIVPTINSRQYGQCTWWATARRIETGRSVQLRGQSYSGGRVIGTDYIPEVGHLLMRPAAPQHQAFIETVSTTSTNWANNQRIHTYTISISEANVLPTWAEKVRPTWVKEVKVREYQNPTRREIISGSFYLTHYLK